MLDKDTFMAWLASDGSIPLDIHAQELSSWEWLRDYVPGVRVSSLGGYLLVQAEGMVDEYSFYFRAEWGSATLKVALNPEDIYLNPLYSASVDYEVTAAGVRILPEGMNPSRGGVDYGTASEASHFVPLFVALVPRLTRAPFFYEFHGPGGAVRGARAHSAGAAYELTKRYVPHRREYLGDAQQQLAAWEELKLSPTPLSEDTRAFPAADPSFIHRA